MKKGGFLQNSNFYLYLIQFWSKFHITSWLYCLFKVSPCLFYVCSSPCALVFFFILCHRKRGFLVKFQFLEGSRSVFVKFSRNFIVIVFIKGFTIFTCCFIYSKLYYRKRVLIVFYCRYHFLGLSNQTFLSFFKTVQDICCGSKAPDYNFILSLI